MDDARRQRLSLARELITWGKNLPRLIKRIDDALELPNLSLVQENDMQSMAEGLLYSFRAVGRIVQADDNYGHLVAATDRLREEITAAEATLHQLLERTSMV